MKILWIGKTKKHPTQKYLLVFNLTTKKDGILMVRVRQRERLNDTRPFGVSMEITISTVVGLVMNVYREKNS